MQRKCICHDFFQTSMTYIFSWLNLKTLCQFYRTINVYINFDALVKICLQITLRRNYEIKKNSIWNHEVKVNEIVIRVSYCTFIVLFGKSFSFSTVECESQSLYFCISVLVLVSVKYESKSNINEGLLKHYFWNIIYKNYIICFFYITF